MKKVRKKHMIQNPVVQALTIVGGITTLFVITEGMGSIMSELSRRKAVKAAEIRDIERSNVEVERVEVEPAPIQVEAGFRRKLNI